MRLPPLRAARDRAIPYGDAAALTGKARRTLAVRIAIGAALLACLAAAVSVSRGSAVDRRTFFSTARSSVVVIDTSGSIGPGPQGLVGRVLRKLIEAHSSFGLVFFSDTAYEAVPPGTRWTELQPLLRFFGETRGADRTKAFLALRSNPWAQLRGGTNISTGLGLALDIVERQHARDAGVLLLSDLDNSLFDMPNLTRVLSRYAAARVPLRVIGLEANPDNVQYFARVLGSGAIVKTAELPPAATAGTTSVTTAAARTPAGLTTLVLVLLVLLGANELWSARLRWRVSEGAP
jgi:hypothetical protein